MLGMVACICNHNTGEVRTGCLRVSTAGKRHHDHSNSKAALVHSSRRLAHHRREDKHGGTQASMVLEKELRVLHLDPQSKFQDNQGCYTEKPFLKKDFLSKVIYCVTQSPPRPSPRQREIHTSKGDKHASFCLFESVGFQLNHARSHSNTGSTFHRILFGQRPAAVN